MRRKVLAGIMAAVLAMTGIFTAVACSGEKGKENSSATEDVVTDNDGMDVVDGENSMISMLSREIKPAQYASYGVSPQSEMAYTIEATVLPEYRANTVELVWTAEFERFNAAWVKDKDVSDYIKITPIGDLAHQAVIECLQGFGEAIVIKAAAKSNPNVFGTCICNYIKRYDNVGAKLDDGTLISFDNGVVSTFTFETSNIGQGKVTFTGLNNGVGTVDSTVFDLSMEISDVLHHYLHDVGFTIYDTCVNYGAPLYAPQVQLGYYGYETMLYLPGADASIIGAEHSELIRQAYLWVTTGMDDDGVLSAEEIDAYNRYREAVLSAWQESDEFLITLVLTQYDSKENRNVLRQYEVQMDFNPEELFPEISSGSITLNYSKIDF